MAEFKRGRQSVEDDPRPGRPVTVATPKMANKVHDIVMTDRRITERYIASTVGISHKRVHSILTDVLLMRKLSARWVPRLLTVNQMHNRRTLSRANLNLIREILSIFFKDLSLWMKHGFIILSQRQNISRNSGSTLAHPGQRRQILFLQLGRLWPQFSGMQILFC